MTFRGKGQRPFNGTALPFFSVDTTEEAERLRVRLCKRLLDRSGYRLYPFGGEVEDIPGAADRFRAEYERLKAETPR